MYSKSAAHVNYLSEKRKKKKLNYFEALGTIELKLCVCLEQ